MGQFVGQTCLGLGADLTICIDKPLLSLDAFLEACSLTPKRHQLMSIRQVTQSKKYLLLPSLL
jgi:hypothetical protein